jgi:serine/threonine protein kinase
VANVTAALALNSSRYRLLKLLASGGLSEVYLARDDELNRDVALKVMRGSRRKSPWGRARLLFEAEVTAGLEHPGIVPVYSRGFDASDQPYFAMRYIHGDNFSDVASHQLDAARPRARARVLRRLVDRLVDVCYTVDFANSRGIIHRDLTPRNLMLGCHGETLVVDWGLARRIDSPAPERPFDWPCSARDLPGTRLGTSVGTPRYMSPEQAEGRWDRLGPATDVFGLGTTLYRLLTGRAPFAASDRATSEARAARVECPAPREVDSRIPMALEAVCLKAMMREPEARYASAIELGDDLARWVAGEPVSVPKTATLRLWQQSRHE